MPYDILALLLLSGLIHATWNFLSKTINSGIPYIWLTATMTSIIYLPVVIYYSQSSDFQLDTPQILALALTSVLHLIYFIVLQKGYQLGDLSVVYPLARGTGPLFTTIGACLSLGESLQIMGMIGLIFIIIGVLLISEIFKVKKSKKLTIGITYGVGTGLLIALYNLFDGYAVKYMAVPLLLVEYTSHPLRIILLLPKVLMQKSDTRALWEKEKWKISTIALLTPISYMLVLHAMKIAPIHSVTPIREISIVFGVLLGGKLLAEQNFYLRLLGALSILIGIIFLATAK